VGVRRVVRGERVTHREKQIALRRVRDRVPPPTDWWERLYRSSNIEQLPWYTTTLDPDIEAGFEAHGPVAGKVLDLGTGPGTHAVALAGRGLTVVATDISPTAIAKAKALARKHRVTIDFRVDNVLNSELGGGFVDAIVDRGTFHVLPPEARPVYVLAVRRILRPGGLLFLKTFSDKEPGDEGPYRLSPGELRGYFREGFDVLSIEDTTFQGTIEPAPRALFATFRRR